MKVLVIGYGSIGKRHADNARRLGHEVLVCDTNMTVHAPGEYTSLEAALHQWPAAVIIATPAKTHADILSQVSLKSRVFVEKPLALSRAELYKAAPQQRHVAVGYQMRFHPHLRELKHIADTMRLGRGIATAVAWQADAGQHWPGTDYADTLAECSHEIDAALYVLGPAKTVYAERVNATWNLALLHDGGVPSKIHLSTDSARYERWMALVGNDGRYAWWGWHGPSGKSTLVRPDKSEETLQDTTHQAYVAELENFLGSAWTGCDMAGGVAVLQVCDEARKMALMAHATT